MTLNNSTKRHFTEAARASAIIARKLKAAEKAQIPIGTPEVFVIRMQSVYQRFGWEIRRFGSIIIEKSNSEYCTIDDARLAGNDALEKRVSQR